MLYKGIKVEDKINVHPQFAKGKKEQTKEVEKYYKMPIDTLIKQHA